MPELPEVETIRRDLEDRVVRRRILDVKVVLPKLLRGYPPEDFVARLRGRRLVGARRRAKILILELDSGDCLLIHLKMSGRLIDSTPDQPVAKHTHLVFYLDNGHELRFVDMRQFGYFRLIDDGRLEAATELRDLGPEPLADDFDPAAFTRLLHAKQASRRPIKALLIDQTFIAGIGNLYADEVLFAAGIRPTRVVASLDPADIRRLYREMRRILTAAIEHRGTSFDLYVDVSGRRGGYLERLQVYGRAGQPCARCGRPLERTKVAGRGTHFCSHCQR